MINDYKPYRMCTYKIEKVPIKLGAGWVKTLEKAAQDAELYTNANFVNRDQERVVLFYTRGRFFYRGRLAITLHEDVFYNELRFVTVDPFTSSRRDNDAFHRLQSSLETLLKKERLDSYSE